MVKYTEPNNKQPITELWAYVSLDESGNEGICGTQLMGVSFPFVFGYERMAVKVRPLVESMVENGGTMIRLVKFTAREDIETFGGSNARKS